MAKIRDKQPDADAGRVIVDEQLEKLEARLTSIYGQASKEMQSDLNSFMERYKEQDEAQKAKVENGEITQKQYEDWKNRQIFRSNAMQAKIDDLAQRMVHADEQAMAMVNDQLPETYATSYNFGGYKGETYANEAGFDYTQFTIINQDAVKTLMKDNPDLIPWKPDVDVPEDKKWNRQKVQEAVLQGIVKGDSMDDVAKRLLPIVNMDKNAAIRTARTAVNGIENKGRKDATERVKEAGIPMVERWSCTHDDRTRDTHILLDGTEPNNEGKFGEGILSTLIEYPGDPAGDPEEVYNCFVGDTYVSTNTDIERSYKHEYKGDLITIKTSAGVEFSCTPNHPILTVRGWIPAKFLDNGDNLVVTCRKNNIIFGRNPDIDHALTRIDTIHQLLDEIGSKRVCTLGVNFHGDIPTSEVEIITKKRFLRNNSNTGRCKFVDKFLLIFTDKSLLSNSPFMKHFRRVRLSSLGFICRKNKPFAIRFGGLRHSQVHSLRPIALMDASIIEPIDNSISGGVEFLCESLDGFTGVVFTDKIIDVNVDSVSTHVYNLQTSNGYYFVNSNIPQNNKNRNDIMVVAHNCRCGLLSTIAGIDHTKDKDLYAQMMEKDYFEDWVKVKEDIDTKGKAFQSKKEGSADRVAEKQAKKEERR